MSEEQVAEATSMEGPFDRDLKRVLGRLDMSYKHNRTTAFQRLQVSISQRFASLRYEIQQRAEKDRKDNQDHITAIKTVADQDWEAMHGQRRATDGRDV